MEINKYEIKSKYESLKLIVNKTVILQFMSLSYAKILESNITLSTGILLRIMKCKPTLIHCTRKCLILTENVGVGG